MPPSLPASLRLLKALVIVLLIVMILAVPSVVWLLVQRLPPGGGNLQAAAAGGALPVLPPALALPAGLEVKAVTFGQGFVAVLSAGDVLFLFDREGRLLQEVALRPGG